VHNTYSFTTTVNFVGSTKQILIKAMLQQFNYFCYFKLIYRRKVFYNLLHYSEQKLLDSLLVLFAVSLLHYGSHRWHDNILYEFILFAINQRYLQQIYTKNSNRKMHTS